MSIQSAAREGNLKKINKLLKQKAVINNVKELLLAFQAAVSAGHVSVVKRLLEVEAVRENAAADDNQALRVAAESGYSDIVDKLLEIDVVHKNAAADNNRALERAAYYGHFDIVDKLLEIDAVRKNAAGGYGGNNEILKMAISRGHSAVAGRLLKVAVVRLRAATCQNDALRTAASKGDVDVVNGLLDLDIVSQNKVDELNWAVETAACNGHAAVVDRFFKIPAVLKRQIESRRFSCLRISIERCQGEVVEYLLGIPEISSEVEAILRDILNVTHTPRDMLPNILMLAELCNEKGIRLPSDIYIKVDEKQESVEALQKSLTFLKTIAGYFVWDLQKIILEYSDLPSSIALKQQQYKQSAPKNPPVSSPSIQCKQQLSGTSTLEGQIGSAPPILHSYTSVQQKSTEKPIEKLLSCINQLKEVLWNRIEGDVKKASEAEMTKIAKLQSENEFNFDTPIPGKSGKTLGSEIEEILGQDYPFWSRIQDIFTPKSIPAKDPTDSARKRAA